MLRFILTACVAFLLAACGGSSDPDAFARSAAAADAAGPMVQSTEPAGYALNVPRNAALVVRFTQPIIVSSVGRLSLRLVGPAGPVTGSFDAATCGIIGPCEFPSGVAQEVTFRPAAPLEAGTQYALEVNGVRAVGGAMVARFNTVFTTEIVHGADSRLSAGGGNSCAVLAQGQVKCWGINYAGQLGINSDTDHGGHPGDMGAALPAVPLGAGRTAVQVAVGDGHSCALLDDSSVKCWGYNEFGQLGQGHTYHLGTQHHTMDEVQAVALALEPGDQVAAIAAGGFRTCALSQRGVLKCWGQNKQASDGTGGFLGLGDTENRGDGNDMGAALPAVNVGAGRRVAQVAMGHWHSCALLDDGSLKCWGRNHKGQLGLGDTVDRGASASGMGDGLPAVDLGERRAVRVTAGELHTCAILDDQSVKCWGYNEDGRLGLGTTTKAYGDGPLEMGGNLPAIELATASPVAIAAGKDHTCVRFANASVKCWGLNYNGQLGLGNKLVYGDQSTDMGANLPAVDLAAGLASVSPGGSFGCARLQSDAVKCWGHNDRGQLGLRDTADRGDEPLEMGLNLLALSF